MAQRESREAARLPGGRDPGSDGQQGEGQAHPPGLCVALSLGGTHQGVPLIPPRETFHGGFYARVPGGGTGPAWLQNSQEGRSRWQGEMHVRGWRDSVLEAGALATRAPRASVSLGGSQWGRAGPSPAMTVFTHSYRRDMADVLVAGEEQRVRTGRPAAEAGLGAPHAAVPGVHGSPQGHEPSFLTTGGDL